MKRHFFQPTQRSTIACLCFRIVCWCIVPALFVCATAGPLRAQLTDAAATPDSDQPAEAVATPGDSAEEATEKPAASTEGLATKDQFIAFSRKALEQLSRKRTEGFIRFFEATTTADNLPQAKDRFNLLFNNILGKQSDLLGEPLKVEDLGIQNLGDKLVRAHFILHYETLPVHWVLVGREVDGRWFDAGYTFCPLADNFPLIGLLDKSTELPDDELSKLLDKIVEGFARGEEETVDLLKDNSPKVLSERIENFKEPVKRLWILGDVKNIDKVYTSTIGDSIRTYAYVVNFENRIMYFHVVAYKAVVKEEGDTSDTEATADAEQPAGDEDTTNYKWQIIGFNFSTPDKSEQQPLWLEMPVEPMPKLEDIKP